ncbi:MAG TPA: TonB-dependent receptor [Candidatus Saccharimonadales bacterium]|nr:TonB-dependent receptor [Candidatus Saccharimonadales bacterium]
MKEITSKRNIRLLLTLLFCFVLPVSMFAQSTTAGAIGGQVNDPSNAVVSGARIAVLNNGTGDKKQSVADSYGKFRIINLQPGTYTLEVSAPSFAGYKAVGVIVEVGRVTEIEVALRAGSASETVEVTSEAPTVNTVQQDFNSNIDHTTIDNLPTNGRRWSNFALLTPGATPDGNFGLISFRGISGLLNNNTVDGGDNNQAFFSEERGRTRASYTVSQNSVREFQVNTSNYSSEYGRAAGGVVNSVTKSGSNQIHGEAFYYIRDNTLGATNPFSTNTVYNAATSTYVTSPFKPDDRRHQFGGNVGGAIIKDRLFYFFNYDGQRRDFPGVGQANNPTAFFKQLTLAAPTGGCPTTTTLLNKLSEANYLYCKKITQAQFNDALKFFASEVGQVPRTGDQNILFPKVDWKINSKNTLALSYNRMRWDSPAGIQTQPVVSYATNSFGNDYVKTDMFIARLSSMISSNITNEFRYQWGRDFEFETSQDPSAAETAWKLGTSYGGRPPYITVTNGPNMGRYNALERTAYPDERRNQFADTFSIAFGHHLIKAGVDFDRNNDLMDSLYSSGGTYAYSGTLARANLVVDLENYEAALNGVTGAAATKNYTNFTQAFGPTAIKFNTWDYAYFVQDDWKILPRLTLNLGLRYEYEQLPDVKNQNAKLAAFGFDYKSLNSDKNNFGPRVGFAWDVRGDGKTALRGGYGIYYGRINNGAIGGALFSNGGTNTQQTFSNLSTSCGPTFPVTFLGANPTDPGLTPPTLASSCPKPNAVYFHSNVQNPQIHQADLILEQEIARNTVFSVNYLLSLGRELPNFVDDNISQTGAVTVNYAISGIPTNNKLSSLNGTILPVTTYTQRKDATNYAAVLDMLTNVNSNYSALVVQLNHKMTHGVQWLMNYTWSHALDNGQNSTTQTASYENVFDPYNQKLEYGNSNFDKRHKFVASAVWQPEFFKNSNKVMHIVADGWTLAPIVNLSSGTLYSEFVSGTGPTYGLTGGINGTGANRLAPAIGRNSWSYPIFANVDQRVARSFYIKERHKIEFVAEAFNLFNHRIPTGINNTMFYTSTNSATSSNLTYNAGAGTGAFGAVNQAGTNLYRERQVQFAVRYAF